MIKLWVGGWEAILTLSEGIQSITTITTRLYLLVDILLVSNLDRII